MIDEKLMRLTKLVRVREQRRQARERERAERRKSRVGAEQALTRQEMTLQSAIARHDEDAQRVRESASATAPTGDEMAGYLGHLERTQAVIATERASVAAASTVCNVLRREENKAVNALQKATNAHRKTQTLRAELATQMHRSVRVQAELVDDELNCVRAASKMPRES